MCDVSKIVNLEFSAMKCGKTKINLGYPPKGKSLASAPAEPTAGIFFESIVCVGAAGRTGLNGLLRASCAEV